MKQITIFDIIEEPIKEIPCGHLDNIALIGRELRFNELKTMINKKCLIANTYNSKTYYTVIKIMDYWEDCDKIYRRVKELPDNCLKYSERVNGYIHDVVGQKEAMACYEEECSCDRVSYSNNERSKEANCSVSEMYCSNGRYKPINDCSESFFELNML